MRNQKIKKKIKAAEMLKIIYDYPPKGRWLAAR